MKHTHDALVKVINYCTAVIKKLYGMLTRWGFSVLNFNSKYTPFALWDADFVPPGERDGVLRL